VAAALEPIVPYRGTPQAITVDNGSEFASRALDVWAYHHGVQLDFIRPGRPIENPFIEAFNGRLPTGCAGEARTLAGRLQSDPPALGPVAPRSRGGRGPVGDRCRFPTQTFSLPP